MILIGLLGPAGAGKTCVASYLVEKYGAIRYSLAKPLKDFCMNALEFTHEQCWGDQISKEAPDPRYGGKSARWFMQRLGTEGGRKTFGDDFWTRMCLDTIAREAPTLAVIDDARFVNEAKAIRGFTTPGSLERKGFVWRLDSPDRETSADATHASEREWMDAPYDFLIAPNERGLPLLYQLVKDACHYYGITRGVSL